jgi:DNA polymerase-3 subunit alpha (Gram-positive type)
MLGKMGARPEAYGLGGFWFCLERSSLRVLLDLPQAADRALLDQLKAGLKGESTRVVLYPCYPSESLPAEEFFRLHFSDLKDELLEELDLSSDWLDLCDYRLESDLGGRKLVWLVESPFHRDRLLNLKAPQKFRELVQKACGLSPEISLEVGEFGVERDKRVQELASYKPPAPSPVPAAAAKGAASPGGAVPVPEKVLVGRLIPAAKVRPLSSVVEEDRNLVLEGRIFKLEEIQLKTGRVKVKFTFTDGTDSLLGILWLEGGDTRPAGLENGARIRARGTVKPDRYENDELVLEAVDITRLPPAPGREDLAAVKRVELHAHTKMSAADSVVDVEAYVAQAIRWGHPAVAITDHGVVHAFPAAAKAAKNKIKLLLGCEAYLIQSTEGIEGWTKATRPPYFHLILLCANEKGRKNLYQLVSHAHLKTFYSKPLISKEMLAKHREGIILGSACEQGELMQAVIAGRGEAELESIAQFYDYLEVQPLANNAFMLKTGMARGEEDLKTFVKKVVSLGARMEKPVVATGDVHFLNPEDEMYRRILQVGNGMEDAEEQAPLYFRTTDEMLAEFAWLGPETAQRLVVDNPRKVAEWCEAVPPVPAGRFFPEMPGAEERVENLARQRAAKLYGKDLPPFVSERLERELKAILQNKFAVLYEIARQLVQESNQRGFSVGSRGSVGSSLVAYLLGITEVNPLPAHELCGVCGWAEFKLGERLSGVDLAARQCPKCGGRLRRDGHQIPFETFVGFKGNKVPDIDLNFAPEVQGDIQRFAETLFGEGRAFKAGTINTLSEKTAFGYVKKYFEAKGQTKRKVEIERIKAELEGVKRTSGSHPGGVILVRSDRDITDFTPVQYSGDSRELGGREAKDSTLVTTHFDYHAIDENLVKLDILGKDDASAFKHLQELTGIPEQEVPLDSPEALSIFHSRQALGLPKLSREEEDLFGSSGVVAIPEFGTENTRRMLELTKPKNFTELIYISGLSHGTNVWTRNADELIKSGTATLETVISTRDDIMNRLVRQGMDPAMAFDITEKVRKGAVSREGFTPEQEKALADAKLPKWWIDSCRKISYMFPKAHATAYCFTAVRMAWFKVKHPRAFYAAWLTLHGESFESPTVGKGKAEVLARIGKLKAMRLEGAMTARDEETLTTLTVAHEALLRGVTFLPVDLYHSHPFRFMPGKGANDLLPPLVSVGGLGTIAANHVVREREAGPFKSVEDLGKRAGLNKTVLEKLSLSGTLDVLPKTNQITLF